VFARRHQRALRAALLHQQLALKRNRRVLQLLKTLLLEHLPDLFLVHISPLRDHFSLVRVQSEIELLMGKLEVAFDGRNIGYSGCSAGFRLVENLAGLHVTLVLAVTFVVHTVLDRGVALRLLASLPLRVL